MTERTKNTIVAIGYTGSFTAYLNVPVEEAIRRYCEDMDSANDPAGTLVEVYEVGDQIGAYWLEALGHPGAKLAYSTVIPPKGYAPTIPGKD